MGDRTTVTLQILKVHIKKAHKIFGDDCDLHYTDELFEYYSFSEVNRGNLDFLDELQEAGIPFTSSYGSGAEYGPGNDYLRFFPDGTYWRGDVADDSINPSLTKCMELLGDYEALKEFITSHYDAVTPPSWDNQEEYAKLFLARRLIDPERNHGPNT